jgi:hypothetical protein
LVKKTESFIAAANPTKKAIKENNDRIRPLFIPLETARNIKAIKKISINIDLYLRMVITIKPKNRLCQ